MSSVYFNYMEPNGFTPTQFVNFRPKNVFCGAPAPELRSTQNGLNEIEEKKTSTKSEYVAIAKFEPLVLRRG